MDSDAQRAYHVLRCGGIVLLPTDVGYGLVACSDAAIGRIYELKGRPAAKPCVTVANAAILDDVAELADARLREWTLGVARTSPIAVINRVRPESRLLARLSPFALGQATTNGTIATFLNAGALVSEIAELALADDRIVVGSSANLASTGNRYRLAEVPAVIRDAVDLVIDGGDARYENSQRLATTILDLTTFEFQRIGIAAAEIEASWKAFRGLIGGSGGKALATAHAVQHEAP
jgi:tRNA A37 threonylcarbamoyladenosine synthetase subunit TsaC/SUA5/YrdC